MIGRERGSQEKEVRPKYHHETVDIHAFLNVTRRICF